MLWDDVKDERAVEAALTHIPKAGVEAWRGAVTRRSR